MSSGSGLLPSEHAAFAVTSRLISCLVTERILRGFYVPILQSVRMTGVLVVLSNDSGVDKVIGPKDILVLVPLRQPPVFNDEATYKHGRLVGLVDPLDMYPEVLELVELISTIPSPVSSSLIQVTSYSHYQAAEGNFTEKILSSLAPPFWELGSAVTKKVTDPVYLWDKLVHSITLRDALCSAIKKEIQSSFEYQRVYFRLRLVSSTEASPVMAYLHPPKRPSLKSSSIEWEQSLVAGHPTHPVGHTVDSIGILVRLFADAPCANASFGH
jgi:hypothetical protein